MRYPVYIKKIGNFCKLPILFHYNLPQNVIIIFTLQ